MNYSEVKELLAAGFTHDEIMGFVNNPQNPQDIHNPNIKHDDPEKGSENEADSAVDPQPVVADPAGAPPENPNIPNDDRFNQLNETMNKLIKTIQTSNLQTATFGVNKETDLNSEVDKIMANLIRPEHDEKGGISK